MKRLVYSIFFFFSAALLANTGRVPHDYESQGGQSLGLNNGGSASVNGLGAIRANPAMLAADKKYELNASYMWPSSGREVYQLGAVDSKTSSVAMGVLYTGHREGYTHWRDVTDEKQEAAFYDSALKRRIAVGLAYNFSSFSIGINGSFVDGSNQDKSGTSGVTFGFGAMLEPLKDFRLGASVENIVNGKVKEIAPRIYRVGASYKMFDSLTFNADYIQRQRVPQERPYATYSSQDTLKLMEEEEKTAILSASFLLKELLLFSAGYGRSFDKTSRNSAAGSISLAKNNFYLGYALRRPYFEKEHFTHTLQASYYISL